MTSRREFVLGGTAALLTAHPLFGADDDIRLGCASIAWNGEEMTAIDEIASLGFRGIQLRSNILPQFGTRPKELRALLDERKLTLVALSSGGVSIDPTMEASVITQHAANAKFVSDVGGHYLQVTDTRPTGRAIESADYVRLGRILTEIGKRTADLGIPLGYHNHMGALGEKPDEVARILDAADPRFVKLELDIAHYHQGGGDPAQAIRTYADRLLFLHIKDVESPVPGATGNAARSYRFVELGRGRVDIPAVFAALRAVKFRGWAVIELDSVPDKARSPREAIGICKQYLSEKVRVSVG